ncbi:hypothetical protein CAPTEDRAFT_212605 [Capitella teleta]|uniref:TMEM205-like domain-containing protein n=1 Tax=Capitella teleta TaxID=283909 RepID=R7U196_CAPTE|nr:hypothetical protein CAPTEDRAFT_212605 [Capitella teleta]|eukprot:ELT99983.1 hypothetical protein CAPTEDRAFT_212605 [Capitella teleta]
MAEKQAEKIKIKIGSTAARQVCASLVITLAVYAAYSGDWVGPNALVALQAFLHLLATCALFGMQAWVSFFGGLALFRALPRKYFGMAQEAQFPVYFRIGFFLSFFLFFSCYIVPKARQLQIKMYSMEGASAEVNMGSNVPKEIQNIPRYAELRKEFGKLHGVSILLNMLSLLIITCHVFYLSRGLKL